MTTDPQASVSASVVLVHGWGGSFTTTWQRSGFTALLADVERHVIGIDLLGHGTAPKPHEPEAYADLTERVFAAMPDETSARDLAARLLAGWPSPPLDLRIASPSPSGAVVAT